mmetsp:Transcript_6301/g.6851  ORF Transcript_6301/g.6851 Transcript_6301/m.6851 type:complete len:341 (+) Transcript_6301:240-1262(+)
MAQTSTYARLPFRQWQTALSPERTSLDLSNNYHVPDNQFGQIANKCPQLTELNLAYCSQLSLGTFQKLGTGCKNLETLDLRGCYQLSMSEFKVIGASYPHLRSVNLSYCAYTDDSALQYLYSNHLEEISLDYCLRITDETIINLAKKCSGLKRISLQGCSQLTDRALLGLAMYRPKLEVINLQECTGISDAAVEAIASRCHATLKWLNLSDCEQLKNKSIGVLGHYCKRLEVLLLKQTSFTPGAVPYLVKHLPRLRELSLEGMYRLDDNAIQSLVGVKGLERLDLSFLPALKFTTVAGLMRALPRLNEVRLFGNDFSAQQLYDLRARFKRTRVEHFYPTV